MADTRNVTPDTASRRAIGELHAFSKLLYQHLLTAEIGQTIGYADLSAIIGIDVQHEGRHYLARARNMALRFDHFVFGCVTNVGVKRLDPNGVIAVAESHVASASRTARRGLAKVATVDLTAVAPAEATRALVARAQLGVQRTFGAERVRRDLTATAESGGALPSAKSVATQSLKLFGTKKG